MSWIADWLHRRRSPSPPPPLSKPQTPDWPPREDHPFCSFCGSPMRWQYSTKSYDQKTGQPIWQGIWQCSEHRPHFADGHDHSPASWMNPDGDVAHF